MRRYVASHARASRHFAHIQLPQRSARVQTCTSVQRPTRQHFIKFRIAQLRRSWVIPPQLLHGKKCVAKFLNYLQKGWLFFSTSAIHFFGIHTKSTLPRIRSPTRFLMILNVGKRAENLILTIIVWRQNMVYRLFDHSMYSTVPAE